MTVFAIMAERCGLSAAEAARLLGVPDATVQDWACGAAAPPLKAIVELRALYRRIVHSGRELGEVLRIRLEEQQRRHVEIGCADDDAAAIACGFPSRGPHGAAVGIGIMLLPDDVTFELVPWQPHSAVPTATARQADVVRAQLLDRRGKLASLEQHLVGVNEFKLYRDPGGDGFATPALKSNPHFVQWLALTSEIRELESLAKSTGAAAVGRRAIT